MTLTQTARTQGFRVSLAHRGVTLKRSKDASTYEALVEIAPPDTGERTVHQAIRNAAIVRILREDLGAVAIGVGETLLDETNGATYRVVRIEDQPVDIAVRFHCEKSDTA